MATYPDDATISQESFSIISEKTHTNTGATATNFDLDSSATFPGEVLAIADGITQATDSYTIDADGNGITFLVAPNASNLTLRVISVPTRFLVNRSVTESVAVNYSNTSATTVNSNTFLINSNTESFAFPEGANITSTDELFVYVSGVFQDATAYTYPSVVYGNDGIDIGDNTATKLLCNFDGTDTATSSTDESDNEHTLSFENNAQLDTSFKQFGTASLLLDGTNDAVNIAAHGDFDLSDTSFTIECFARPTSGFSSNLCILSRTKDADNFYRLAAVANTGYNFVYRKEGTTYEVNAGITKAKVAGEVDGSTSLTVDNITGGVIIVGQVVTGSGISGTVTVSAVNAAGTGITLSSSQSLSDNVDLTFTFPSGAQFAHVAVSFDALGGDAGTGLLGMYLNNNRFTTNTAFSVSNHILLASAPLQIGNANLLSQDFNGHIDALRITKSAKYRGAKLQPANTAPTVLGGGALGSVDENDKLTIRSIGLSVTTDDRFTSMADRKPDKGFTTGEVFDVTTFASQAGYEKRRLKSRRSKRNYSLNYTNITGIEKTAIEEFYRSRSGTFEAFTFDLSHINDSGTINARFDGPLNTTQVLSRGTALVDNFYTMSFNLREVFD
tara:strand:+ start:371 stop:2215 length:1845 start_codon:yes stop_codon:yes gene_type:complete